MVLKMMTESVIKVTFIEKAKLTEFLFFTIFCKMFAFESLLNLIQTIFLPIVNLSYNSQCQSFPSMDKWIFKSNLQKYANNSLKN